MEISQVDVTPFSPDDFPEKLNYISVSKIPVEKATFLKTSANLSVLYRIPIRIIISTSEGLKSLDGIISEITAEKILINEVSIPFSSINDIQF